ncbi:MAG: hypothetical protein HYY35_04455 [Deltaproteobacteria bacterium]|nr:hypothetical protein [Deltaproteobacteria bacterium]
MAGPVFVAAACFYLLSGGGYIDGPDGTVMFRATQSFARGSLAVEPLASWPEHGGVPVDGGKRFYAWFGPGLSAAALPAYLLGRALLPWTAARERGLFDVERRRSGGEPGFRFRTSWYETGEANFAEAFTAFTTGWTNALVTAATLVLLLAIAVDLGFDARTSLAVVALAAVASPLWPYAKGFFAEALAALGLTGFVRFAVRARRGQAADWAAAGALLGVTMTTRVTHAVLFLPAAMLVLADCRERSAGEARRRLAGFAAGGSLGPAAVGIYNLARFGDPLQTGYGKYAHEWTAPFLEGFAGLLVSPGHGILLYCPLVLLSAAAARRFAERAPRELAFVAASLALLVVLYSKWFLWEGAWCWGPRFLLPLVPLLVLPSAALLERFGQLGRAARLAVLAVVALALVVTASGVAINFVDYHVWVRAHFAENLPRYRSEGAANYYALLRWGWRFAPPLYLTSLPSQAFFLPLALGAPGVVLGSFAVFSAGLLGGLLWLRLRLTRLNDRA